MVATYPAEALPVALYVGTITVSSVCITVLDLLVVRRPSLRRPGTEDDARAGLVASAVTTALFAVALLLGTTIRAVDHYGLLLLLLSGLIEQLVTRIRRGRRSAA